MSGFVLPRNQLWTVDRTTPGTMRFRSDGPHCLAAHSLRNFSSSVMSILLIPLNLYSLGPYGKFDGMSKKLVDNRLDLAIRCKYHSSRCKVDTLSGPME